VPDSRSSRLFVQEAQVRLYRKADANSFDHWICALPTLCSRVYGVGPGVSKDGRVGPIVSTLKSRVMEPANPIVIDWLTSCKRVSLSSKYKCLALEAGR
jgi:hypothetical protein